MKNDKNSNQGNAKYKEKIYVNNFKPCAEIFKCHKCLIYKHPQSLTLFSKLPRCCHYHRHRRHHCSVHKMILLKHNKMSCRKTGQGDSSSDNGKFTMMEELAGNETIDGALLLLCTKMNLIAVQWWQH